MRKVIPPTQQLTELKFLM